MAFEYGNLLTQGKDLESDIDATAKQSGEGGNECGYQREHEAPVVTRVNVERDTSTVRFASH